MRVEQRDGAATPSGAKRRFDGVLRGGPKRAQSRAPATRSKERAASNLRPQNQPLPSAANTLRSELATRQLAGSQRFERRLWEALTVSAESAQGREQLRQADRQREFALGWAPEARGERDGAWGKTPTETEAPLPGVPLATRTGLEPPSPGAAQERPPEVRPSEGHVREVRALVERAELFLRDGAPALRLTLDGLAMASAVELTRGADRKVSVRLCARSMSRPEARAAAAQIREALRARGLGVDRVEVLAS